MLTAQTTEPRTISTPNRRDEYVGILAIVVAEITHRGFPSRRKDKLHRARRTSVRAKTF